MQTDFFVKKRWFYLFISQILSLFVLVMLIYAAFLSSAQAVRVGKSFYFLVSKTEHIQAGTYDVQLQGGAGYLLTHEGREYVVLSVYLKDEEGLAVQAAMTEKGEELLLLPVLVDKLYFKTCKEKKSAPLYLNALECFYGCMEVLGLEIDRLSNGATQQSSVRILSLLLKQLRYLVSQYRESFSQYALVCEKIAENLHGLLVDTIYTKDLRYLFCDMAVGYLQLSSNFLL